MRFSSMQSTINIVPAGESRLANIAHRARAEKAAGQHQSCQDGQHGYQHGGHQHQGSGAQCLLDSVEGAVDLKLTNASIFISTR